MNSSTKHPSSVLAPPTTEKHDPRDTAQEAVHEVTSKANAEKLTIPQERPDTAPGAAKGDDDLMSKPQQPATPAAETAPRVWKHQLGAARINWSKLTDDELLKTEGHTQKLAALVQERYALTPEEARVQIRRFFDTRES